MDINTLLQNMPLLMGLVAIVYWTSVAKPFIERFTNPVTGEHDGLAGTDFTRLFAAGVGVLVSFLIAPFLPIATWQMSVLLSATLAAFADGTYTKILKKFVDEEQELTTIAIPGKLDLTQPTAHLGEKPSE